MNNIVSSEGAAKTTMCALLLGAVLNIGLDPLFIYTFNMGVAGAAIATAISQLVSTLVYAYIKSRRSSLTCGSVPINLLSMYPVFRRLYVLSTMKFWLYLVVCEYPYK